jgi:CRP/FNR family transcriptional regulator
MVAKQETHCQSCPLRATGAFSGNTKAEIAFIQDFKKGELRVPAGGVVVRESKSGGDRELYTLLSGWAFRYRSLSDGRRQIFNFLLPGDFIGLQDQIGATATYGVEALTDVTLCVFPRTRLWDLYRSHPELGFDLTWLCAHEELIVDENLLSVGRRSAAERIAMLLIHLYKRADSVGLCDEDGVLLPLTQQHFADALGLSLVHVNKTLKRLHAQGLYTLVGGRLQLHNTAAIARLADYYALPLRGRPLI